MIGAITFSLQTLRCDAFCNECRGNGLRTFIRKLLVGSGIAGVVRVPTDLQAHLRVSLQYLGQVVQLLFGTHGIQRGAAGLEGHAVEVEPSGLVRRFTAFQETDESALHSGSCSFDL